MARQTLFRDYGSGVCSRGERLNSTLNSSRTRIREGVHGWKITQKKQQRKGEFWLKIFDRVFAEGGPE